MSTPMPELPDDELRCGMPTILDPLLALWRRVRPRPAPEVPPFVPEPRDRVELPADTFGDLTYAAATAREALTLCARALADLREGELAQLYADRLEHALKAAHDQVMVTEGGDEL